MTVDKFGHYYNQKYNSEVLKKNVSKMLGITVDEDYNINIQNKKIRNIAPPTEDSDAVNKAYLYSQIKHIQEILKHDLNTEFNSIRSEISELKKKLKDIYAVLSSMPQTPTIIYNNNNEKTTR